MRPKSRVVSGLVASALGYLAIHAPTGGEAQAVEPSQPSASAQPPAQAAPPAPTAAAEPSAPAEPAAPAEPPSATAPVATPVPTTATAPQGMAANAAATTPAAPAAVAQPPATTAAEAPAPTTPTTAAPLPAAPPAEAAPVSATADISISGGEAEASTDATQADATQADATQADATQADAEEASAAESEAAAKSYRQYNTLNTSTGGLHIQDANVGTAGAFRLQLGLEYFSSDDVFFNDDEVEQQSQKLSWSWTATDDLELFASLTNHGSSSTIPKRSQGGTLSALGDVTLGGKVGFEVAPGLYLGSALRLTLLPSVGSEQGSLKNTSGGLTAMLSADLRRSADVPIIGRLNVDYALDNSAALVEDFEDDKYGELEDPEPKDDELRHLINRFERFALGINRVDLLTIGLGAEAPISLGHNMALHPMAEWTIGIPINRQGYDCAFRSSNKKRGRISSEEDSCLEDLGLKGIPQKLTAGVRFVPPIPGLSAFLAVDVALTGAKRFSQELAPIPSYRLLFGAGYDFDPGVDKRAAQSVETATATASSATASSPEGRVAGIVIDRRTGEPISNVQVRFVGTDLTALSTADNGEFVSYALAPGAVVMDLRHPDYDTAQCAATIAPEGGEAPVSCSMEQAAQTGSIQGQLREPYGTPVGYAVLKLSGPTNQSISTNSQGYFSQGQLPTGTYQAQVEAPGYLARTASLKIHAQTQTDLEFTLTPKPDANNVRLQDDQIQVKNLVFADNKNALTAGSESVMAELADVLIRYPALKRVRIEAPGEGSLSLARGEMLKQRLVNLGIDASRLETAGTSPAALTVTVVQQ